MTNQIRKVETSILKSKNFVTLHKQLQDTTDEENRLMSLLTPENDEITPEIQAVQKLRNDLFDQVVALMNNCEEITYFRGYSFIDKYFNVEQIYEGPFDITREKVAQFIAECNLVLENPEVAESILPVIEKFETPTYVEDTSEFADESGLKPIYYDEEYLNKVRYAKEVFTNILNNNDWVNDAILIQTIR